MNLPETADAQIWAKEFVRVVKDNPTMPTDEETMIGWFANSIMAGYDFAQSKTRRRFSMKIDIKTVPEAIAMGRMQQKWTEFEKTVLSPNAPAIQRSEMKKAFFMGGLMMLDMTASISGEMDEDAGAAELEKLDRECRAFFESLGLNSIPIKS